MPSSPKPKDLTGSLVTYKERRGSKAPRLTKKEKERAERKPAFDPFTFVVWCLAGMAAAVQLALIILPDYS